MNFRDHFKNEEEILYFILWSTAKKASRELRKVSFKDTMILLGLTTIQCDSYMRKLQEQGKIVEYSGLLPGDKVTYFLTDDGFNIVRQAVARTFRNPREKDR